MGRKITSIIEVSTEGCTMPKHKKVSGSPKVNEEKPHNHHYKSEATTDRNRFFHGVKTTNDGVTQNVSVTVNVDQKEDCMTGCFSAIAKCFGRGASGAGGA